MVHIGFKILSCLSTETHAQTTAEELRSLLILRADGEKTHGRSYHVTKLAYHALSTSMSPNDLSVLHRYTERDELAVEEQVLSNNAHMYV